MVALAALLVAVPVAQPASAGPTTVTQTYSYTGSTSVFTVPAGITALTVTITGAEGGNGGADATPAPPAGGYRGVVSGTLAVTPGQELTVAVGSRGATGVSARNSSNGVAAVGGLNPLAGYDGGTGGKAGAVGSSGFGGAGGAASVLQVSGADVVAAGGGGNGGSGQYASTRGRTADSTYRARTDATSTNGQTGLNANDVCSATSCSNNDGGGSGGGGGGAQGGAQGDLQFGAGTSNEWYGFGGSVGQNSTAGLSGLTASYQYYADNATDGSIVISYTTGSPAAPTAVSGTAGNGSAALIWTAPTDPGQSAITDYVIQYSSNSGSTWSSDVATGSTATTGTVTGLTNGTSYIFRVAAVNSVGTGVYSTASAAITPQGPPSAPSITTVTPQDAALRLSLAAPTSGATATSYDYRLNSGSWVNVASTSTTLIIPGLINGTTYTVEVRAQSGVGPGASSSPSTGTPEAVPGAPTITALAVGNRSIAVSFTPGFTGGGAITSYQYRLNASGWVTATGTSSPITISGLNDGTSYSIELRAVNASGSGVASAPASASTPAVPGVPSVTSITGGDSSANVSFIPGTTGGAPIDYYEYKVGAAGTWTTAATSTSPLTITGLENGVAVEVSIRAVNAVGAGVASAPVSVLPATVPSAPSIVGNTVAGSDAQLIASFTAPASDGGASITGYQYSTDAGATWRYRTDGGTTASPVAISALSSDGTTALVNGVTYFVELRAVNAVGPGTASAVASGIATTVPSAPTVTQIVAGPEALTVDFTAGSNGGAAISAYQYSIDGGSSWLSTGTLGTTFTISGLTNGHDYPVRVRAVNAQGAGPGSTPETGTPVALPGRPTISSVLRSNQTLTAAVALVDNGGSPVTSWQYSTDGGATWSTAAGTSSPLALTTVSSDGTTRLSNGTGYALTLRAVTAIGTGPASATTTVAPASAPAAPSIALTPGNASLSVAFTFGIDGGSPVSALEYTLDGGSTWINTGTLSSPFTIIGLTNGTSYAVQLRANNAIGAGTASAASSTTPRTVPDSPTAVAAVSNTSSADVSWSAPAFNGGATITGYTASAYTSTTATSATSSCTTSTTSCSIPSLTNGTTYYVSVSATNVAGTGTWSGPRVLVTPLARPSAPTLTALTMGDGSISVAFTAGAAGDRAITGYQYSTNGGTTWAAASGSSSPIIVTGLTNGTTYTMALRAVSSAGVGAKSNTITGTPYTFPSAPDPAGIVVNAGDRQVIVAWPAANLNGGTLQNYTATAFTALASGSTAATCTTTTLTCTLTGLTNGTTYYVSLQTQNTASMYSVRSAPRVPATPSLQPGAPTAVVATAGNAQAAISWVAPTSTGASAITGYIVRCSANGGSYTQCGTPTSTSTTITGLTNGASYTFVVLAVNASGNSPVSVASSAITPLAPGTAPTFTAAVRTATGFTTTISNYDASTSYSATASNGASVAISGATVTVTGLSNGAASTATVTAAKAAYTTTSASLAAAALLTGVAPTFSGNLSTETGFSFTISNFDPLATYTFAATNGANAVNVGAVVTVSGLSIDQGSAVTVTVAKAGSTSVSATNAGVALVTGVAPTFSNLVSTDVGFRFDIANYDADLSYSLGTTAGAASQSGATVTVTGLTNGATALVTVTVSDPGVSTAVASQTGAALLSGTAPTVSAVAETVDGFSFTITNLDPDVSYSVSSADGSVVRVGAAVLVSGLTPGQSTDVTIVAVRAGYVTTQTTVSAGALIAGITPLFSAPTATADGFVFTITNYDPTATYSVTSSGGLAANVDGVVTVTGLAPSDSATVTVTVARDGYAEASANQVSTALALGTAPVLTNVVATGDGFTFLVANFDASMTYSSAVAPTGVAVILSDGSGVVSGAAPGTEVTVTVTATDPGISTASASTSATTLLSGLTPALSSGTPLAGGYSFTILNYDPAFIYSFSEANGGAVDLAGGTVTVSGLGAAVASETVVTTSRPGYITESATASGTTFPEGDAPVVSAVTRTLDGFTFSFEPDPAATYTATVDAGSVALVGTTVTVTGLSLGATTTVHLTATVPEVLDSTTHVAGTAIAAGTAPALAAAVTASGGFTVVISNYSSSSGYTLSTSAGTVTRSAATITVSGLSVGASAEVTVTAVRDGYTDASASATGVALPANSPVPPANDPVPAPPAPAVNSGSVPTETGSNGQPSTRSSEPGTGFIQSGGTAVPSRIISDGSSVLLTTGGDLRMTVVAQKDGASQPLAANGVLVVDHAGRLWVTVSGLSPQSTVTMWSMSRPTQLASSRTDALGHTGELITLPVDIEPGEHTLVVSGVDAAGNPVTLQIGFQVLEVELASATTDVVSPPWWPAPLGVLLVLAFGAWVLVARTRSRREEDEPVVSE